MHGIHRIWEHTLKSILRCRVAGVTSELKQALSRGFKRLSGEPRVLHILSHTVQCSGTWSGSFSWKAKRAYAATCSRWLFWTQNKLPQPKYMYASPQIVSLAIENDFLSSPGCRWLQIARNQRMFKLSPDRVAKCQFFYTDTNLSSKCYPKNA